MRRLTSLWRTLFRGSALDRDMDDELRAYIDIKIAERVARGEPGDIARRRVLAEEGGLEPVRERTRAARIGFGVATFVQDLRFGLRTMGRTPGFAFVACATLALGIGANVAMFTVMRSVLWRPLPYTSPEQLAVIEVDVRGIQNSGANSLELLALRERSRTLADVAAINGVDSNLTVDGEMERVPAVSATDNTLRVLGVEPLLGRHLDLRRDMGETTIRAVLISHSLWRRRFSADPAIVGRTISVNNIPAEVVGVLPQDFRLYLTETIGAAEEPDVWFPQETPSDPEARAYRGYDLLARVRPGYTVEQAAAEVDAIRAQFAAERPRDYENVVFRTTALHEAVTARAGAALRALGLAVGFVLLVGCVNVANLMLARSSGRARELAVRRALGASRWRLVRQLMTESALLSAIGGAAGLVLGRLGVGLLDWLRPTHLPRQSQVGMDWTVAVFALGVSAACALLFGLLPALRFAASDAQSLRAGRAESTPRSARRLQRGLIVAEIALSMVPLVAAGLMLRSFNNLAHAPIGFNPDRIVTAHVPLSFRAWPFREIDKRTQLHVTAIEQVKAIPGVEDASAASPLPFGPLQMQARYGRQGLDAAARVLATYQSVMPGYLGITGTRLLQGRDFTADDLAAKRPVVIISERMAAQMFPQGAIGQRLTNNSRAWPELEVIGVTENVRVRHVREEGQAHAFLPYYTMPIEMTLVLRTSQPAVALAPAIKKAVEALGTGRAVHDIKPMRTLVEASVAETRFTMLVLSGFAIASLLLAGIGLYGTLAYLNAQRSREFGVRLALGADARRILRLVAGEGVLLTAAGAVLGVAGALAAARALRSLLYGVDTVDPVTLAGVLGLIAAIAIVASLKPAWSASRVDPTVALRAD